LITHNWGRYTIICDALETSNGRFVPRYRIFDSGDINDAPINQQTAPDSENDCPTPGLALKRAEDLADSWLTEYRGSVG
jgi:hypothetical protein